VTIAAHDKRTATGVRIPFLQRNVVTARCSALASRCRRTSRWLFALSFLRTPRRTSCSAAKRFNVILSRSARPPQLIAPHRKIKFREWLARTDQAIFGAFAPELVGIVGCVREASLRRPTRRTSRGMYVSAPHRGAGTGRKLMQQAMHSHRTLPGVLQVHLSVSEPSHQAAALYQSLGFRTWGVEPSALAVDGAPSPNITWC